MAEQETYKVKTLVFMDLETTGLKENEVNPEITELFMLTVGRREFRSDSKDKVQNSIKLIFNTERPIAKIASKLTGLNADKLSDQQNFNAGTIELLNLFLSRLQKPVCILAHNGKRFDFKLLQAELKRFQQELMPDLFCADTLEGFKEIDKEKSGGILMGMEKLSLKDSPKGSIPKSPKPSYKLVEIFKRKFPTVKVNAHRAESDVKMMYEIALEDTEDFLIWVDKKAVKFTEVSPM